MDIYTTDEQVAAMHAAFDLVKNPENWKYPVDAVIPGDSDTDLIANAVIFFTGSPPTFTHNPDGTLSVFAAGYYSAIGS